MREDPSIRVLLSVPMPTNMILDRRLRNGRRSPGVGGGERVWICRPEAGRMPEILVYCEVYFDMFKEILIRDHH